ncbi:hypothetical protein [Streptomyces hydrogenans]|uniref:hypothetical protein n=1 Tax=Streptomyces hydrogenans TaxID=1873719 RepID=UPI0035DA298A
MNEQPEPEPEAETVGEADPFRIDLPDLSGLYAPDLSRIYASVLKPLQPYFDQQIHLSRFATAAARMQEFAVPRVPDLIQQNHLSRFATAAARMQEFAVPRVPVLIPGLSAAVEAMRAQMADLTGFNDTITQALAPFTALQTARWHRVFASMAEAARGIYPENLRELAPGIDEMETLLVDEGIPLMWVPGRGTVRALLEAPDAVARRRLIGQRWKGIASDCESVLDEVKHPDLRAARNFAQDVVNALRDGHTSAAQALAANLLDSILQRHLSQALRVELTRNNFKANGDKFKLDAYKFKTACTFAPVWYAHAKYYPANGDAIPRTFGRHPSAHGVSKNQYSRINTVYALMLVTSVIKLFDTELPR